MYICNVIIEEAIARFVEYISHERRLAAGTVQNYTNDVESLAHYLSTLGISKIEEVSAREVREWQMQQMEVDSAATVNRKLSSLRAWFRYLRKQQWVQTDVMGKVSSPKVKKKLPVFFRENDVEKIYQAEMFDDSFEGQRDKLLLRMLYETGMRRSEIVGLTSASIDLSAMTIKVLGKRNKERIIPIENELAHNIKCYISLKDQIASDTDYLFVNRKGKPISAAMLYNIVRRYMAPISNADRVSPHVFRHTFATHMLNEGANIDAIKELLGHTDLSATEVYTHVTKEHLKESYKHAHPRATKE